MAEENALSVNIPAGETIKVSFEGKENLLAKLLKVEVDGDVKGETKLLLLKKYDGEEKETELAVLTEEKKEEEIEQIFCANCEARLKSVGESALLVKGEYFAKEEPKNEEKKEE